MVRAPYGLSFETFSPVERSEHFRADVALFVGFVSRGGRARSRSPSGRTSSRCALPARARVRGSGAAPDAAQAQRGDAQAGAAARGGLEHLRGALRVGQRPIQAGVDSTCYLGAAVRAFFAQGGRRRTCARRVRLEEGDGARADRRDAEQQAARRARAEQARERASGRSSRTPRSRRRTARRGLGDRPLDVARVTHRSGCRTSPSCSCRICPTCSTRSRA